MSMKTWAEREAALRIEFERKNNDTDEPFFNYGAACVESALKAFNCLMDDGHSGMSIGFTKAFLNRLIDGKPLTSIEDTEDIWEFICEHNGVKTYQCTRMSSLFKDEYPDGTVKYHDVDRVICYGVSSPDVSYSSGFIRKIIDDMFPITMPYWPKDNPYKVYVEEFLTDPKNGDYDTMGVLYLRTPDGEKIDISRYFKEAEGGFAEIDEDEYITRIKADVRKNK